MRRVRQLAARLLRVFRAASLADTAAGLLWYARQRKVARRLARVYRTTIARACGVIAALSPRLGWTYNVRAAELVLAGAAKVPGVFKASLAKARAIASGARPLQTLGGPKVRAFYRALMGNESSPVVDVWVARAVGVQDAPTAKQYEQVSQALALAARAAGTTVAGLQAVAWVHVRGRA